MRKLFNGVFSLHYLAVLAVIAPFFGAILMLLVGTRDTVDAYLIFFGLEEPEGAIEGGEAAMIKLVASIDHFLFAAVLMIFAVGLYALFFKSRKQDESGQSNGFSWKHLKNMGGMDEMLLKVIIMLLAVSFLEYMLTTGIGALGWTSLVVPLSVIALALSLRWMSAATADDERDDKDVAKAALQAEYLDGLERLASLRERGALTDAEYEAEKADLKQ